MKLNCKGKGSAQIPLLIVLMLMAVAVPMVTKLVQQNTENRSKAAADSRPISPDNKVVVPSVSVKGTAAVGVSTSLKADTSAALPAKTTTTYTYIGNIAIGSDGGRYVFTGTNSFYQDNTPNHTTTVLDEIARQKKEVPALAGKEPVIYGSAAEKMIATERAIIAAKDAEDKAAKEAAAKALVKVECVKEQVLTNTVCPRGWDMSSNGKSCSSSSMPLKECGEYGGTLSNGSCTRGAATGMYLEDRLATVAETTLRKTTAAGGVVTWFGLSAMTSGLIDMAFGPIISTLSNVNYVMAAVTGQKVGDFNYPAQLKAALVEAIGTGVKQAVTEVNKVGNVAIENGANTVGDMVGLSLKVANKKDVAAAVAETARISMRTALYLNPAISLASILAPESVNKMITKITNDMSSAIDVSLTNTAATIGPNVSSELVVRCSEGDAGACDEVSEKVITNVSPMPSKTVAVVPIITQVQPTSPPNNPQPPKPPATCSGSAPAETCSGTQINVRPICVGTSWKLTNLVCSLALKGTKDTCSSTAYCCNGTSWTTDMAGCSNGTAPVLNAIIAYAGVQNEAKCANNWPVAVTMRASDGTTKTYSDVVPVVQTTTSGLQKFKISLKLDGFNFFDNVAAFVKGAKHLQVKYGKDGQTAMYNQAGGTLVLTNDPTTSKVYEFSGYPLLAGDINQDGVVDGVDFSLVKTASITRKSVAEGGYMAEDLNGNCQMESQDQALLMLALNEKQGQLY